jgi:galactitol-specific phosphotransferase system IIC component
MDEKPIEQINDSTELAEVLASVRKEIDPVATVDEVDIYFDWHPSVENGRLLFQTRIIRGTLASRVDFEIDLGKLREVELKQLSDFLSRRHTGLTSGYEVTRTVVWLLDLSLGQQQPGLSKADRDSKVRELLLAKEGG